MKQNTVNKILSLKTVFREIEYFGKFWVPGTFVEDLRYENERKYYYVIFKSYF